MFKFAFDLDGLDNEFAELSVPAQEQKTPRDLQSFAEIQISQLVRPIVLSDCYFYPARYS
jgi:hypothetical protein